MTTTTLTTQNGTIINLEHRPLDDNFCEKAKKYYGKKIKMDPRLMNTYFTARAIEYYIVDNNLTPIYED